MTRELNEIMEFGHLIQVHPDGSITEPGDSPYAELSCYLGDDAEWHDDFQLPAGWSLLTGFTGQHGYNGPVMRPSEFIGGGLERHIRETPGLYMALVVESNCGGTEDGCSEEDGCNCEPDGWAIAYKPLDS